MKGMLHQIIQVRQDSKYDICFPTCLLVVYSSRCGVRSRETTQVRDEDTSERVSSYAILCEQKHDGLKYSCCLREETAADDPGTLVLDLRTGGVTC